MKGLKKLALATAVAAAPFAQAELTAMDDALLEEMTGQAGITIDVDLDMTIDAIKYVDQDGIADFTDVGAGNGNLDVDGNDVGAGNGQYAMVDDQGAITMKGLKIGSDNGTADWSTARIRGITIDVDGTDGLVMGLNQIGDTSGNGIDIAIDSIMINAGNANLALKNASVSKAPVFAAVGAVQASSTLTTEIETEFGAGATWSGLTTDQQKDFKFKTATGQISLSPGDQTLVDDYLTALGTYAAQAKAQGVGDGNVGGLVIEDFRNYIQDSLVGEYNGVFDMALQDSAGALDGSTASGRFVRGEISIKGTGNSIDGTGGVRIAGEFGGAMDKLAWVDGYGQNTDTVTPNGYSDAGEFGVKDLGFFHGVDTDMDGIADTIEGMHFSVDIDVEDRLAWNSTGADDVAALKISNMKMEGTIMMGEIYLGSSTDTVSDQSLGSVLIKDIDMTGTSVYIYGH